MRAAEVVARGFPLADGHVVFKLGYAKPGRGASVMCAFPLSFVVAHRV